MLFYVCNNSKSLTNQIVIIQPSLITIVCVNRCHQTDRHTKHIANSLCNTSKSFPYFDGNLMHLISHIGPSTNSVHFCIFNAVYMLFILSKNI